MSIHLSKRAVLAALAVGIAATLQAAADDDILSKAVNNPSAAWGIYGSAAKSEIVKDPAVTGGAALRVTISPKPEHPWDAGTYANTTKPVRKGDVLLLAFWARAEQMPPGSTTVDLSGRIYEAAPPNTGVTPETAFHITKDWKLYYANGTVTKDYPAGALSCGMLLGSGEQVVDFGPVFVLDFGPGYDVSKLPTN
ncbi:MAG: hypothetical protein KGJ78_06535 [Alphaproteobacteria bacterium]|nr:hypothetical protein [Alphaproteobacteria bacterium]